MCVIIWSPNGKVPINHVTRAMARHPDGWGFSVATGGHGVRTYRSTDRDEFLVAWRGRVAGPVLLHARRATHGRVCRDNCHPFKVKGHGLVAAHNGIIHGFGGANKSDTRDFIENILEPFPKGFHQEQAVIECIEGLIGSSRMVLMDKAGEAVILNEQGGTWRNRLWYSNESVL